MWHGSRTPSRWCTKWIDLYELEYSEPCLEQPEERLNDTYRECNTWRYYPEYPDLWNHTNCPDPCLTYKCPKFAKCVTRNSKKEYKVMSADNNDSKNDGNDGNNDNDDDIR